MTGARDRLVVDSVEVVPQESPRGLGLLDRVLIGSVRLKDLSIKDRRGVVKQLLADATHDNRAGVLLVDLLKGPIPQARPIARTVGASRKRDLLIRAWAESLATAELDAKDAAARARWISKQLPKMKGEIPAHLDDLIVASIAATCRLLHVSDISPIQAAEVLEVIASTKNLNWMHDFDEKVTGLVVGLHIPATERAWVLEQLVDSTGRGIAATALRHAVQTDPDLAAHMLTRMRKRHDRITSLVRAIRDAGSANQGEMVVEMLINRVPDDEKSYYIEVLLCVVEITGELSARSTDLLRNLAVRPAANVDPLVEPTSAALLTVRDALSEMYQRKLSDERSAAAVVLAKVNTEKVGLEKRIEELDRLIESLKQTARAPERETEFRARSATLRPVCAVYQDMLLAARLEANRRLDSLASRMETTLLRLGLTLLGSKGIPVQFDPSTHEYATWVNDRPSECRLIAPGVSITDPRGVQQLLVRAIVEPWEPRDGR